MLYILPQSNMQLLFYFFGLSLLHINECADDLVVQLIKPQAKIRGHALKTQTGKEYYAFQEIPYAGSPRRWTRASYPSAWSGIKDTTKNTKICTQSTNPYKLTVTEDCLYINIYTPQKPKRNGTLSSMLWVHPGDFNEGSGAFQYYNPEYLIEYDIIVVTFNYRLGPLGYLWAGDNALLGNVGLRDQLLAVTWLFDNIAAFGGDPDQIAMVGQGSGAAGIAYVFQYDRATPINVAILHSGNSINPKYYQSDPVKYALKLAKKFNPKLNTTSNLGTEMRKLTEKLSALKIQQAAEEISKEELNEGVFENLVWLPVFEGYWINNPFIENPMLEAWVLGAVRTVPILLGYNSGEMTDWASKQNLKTLGAKYDKDPGLLINKRINIDPKQRSAAGLELKKFYTNKAFSEDVTALLRYLNDQMVIPQMKQASNTSWYLYNFVYQFSYKSDGAKISGDSNTVAHGEELKYIWNTGKKLSKNDQVVQKRLLTLWTNFMKYRDPTPDKSNVLNGAKWLPLNEFQDELNYLNLGLSIKNVTDPIQFKKIDRIMDKYLQQRFVVY